MRMVQMLALTGRKGLGVNMDYIMVVPLVFCFGVVAYLLFELALSRFRDKGCRLCKKDIRKENSMIRINGERHCLDCWEELVKCNDYFDNNNWMFSVHEQMAMRDKRRK